MQSSPPFLIVWPFKGSSISLDEGATPSGTHSDRSLEPGSPARPLAFVSDLFSLFHSRHEGEMKAKSSFINRICIFQRPMFMHGCPCPPHSLPVWAFETFRVRVSRLCPRPRPGSERKEQCDGSPWALLFRLLVRMETDGGAACTPWLSRKCHGKHVYNVFQYNHQTGCQKI